MKWSREAGRFGVAILACCLVVELALGEFTQGYKLVSISDYSDGRGLVGFLRVIDDKNTSYGTAVDELQLSVRFETNDRLRVKITDRNEDRWEIPEWVVPRGGETTRLLNHSTSPPRSADKQGVIFLGGSNLKVSYTSDPFGFSVSRSSGEVLFNSTPDGDMNGLIFKDQFLEVTTQLPAKAFLFGLGESTRPDGLRLSPGRTYTLWATDIGSNTIDIDLYGAYPFYMDMRDGVAHGVLLMNSNGMDIGYGERYLTYRVIGGVLDFYFFPGPSPLAVVDQYTELVGRPAGMPYWSFGFHQSRYGYKDLATVEEVVKKYAEAKLPLETTWSDIDFMDEFKDFTFDPVNYPEDKLRKFVRMLHDNHQRYVIIIDPGIATERNYSTYERGLDLDIYIRDQRGKPYLGQVWPGPVYYPDFLHPNIEKFWTHEIVKFHKRLPFDGLWIDMNEPSNFCSGSVCVLDPEVKCPGQIQTECCLDCESQGVSTRWDDPPYKINSIGKYRELNGTTVSMSSTHYGGIRAYDVHNLYGHTEALWTYRALRTLSPGKRPFILSRSTFVGSGAYAAHWTGDNAATWNDLGYSIVSCLNSGMFGIPMVGSDICGFGQDTTEELCNRWIQVGAFYPFSRDHSDIHSKPQELYLWDSVTKAGRTVLTLRYKLLPYYYTLMFQAHKSGAPIMRPLFFEFPSDLVTADVDTQFFIGSGVLVTPVINKGKDTVMGYFPPGVWYNAFDYSKSLEVQGKEGQFLLLKAPLDTVPVHYRQGFIIPMQEAASTTALARRTPFTLLIPFGNTPEESASGELYLDDGEEPEVEVKQGKSTFVQFNAQKVGGKGTLQATVTAGEFALREQFVVGKVVILGLRLHPSLLYVNGVLGHPLVKISSSSSQSVEIENLNLPLGMNFDLSWAIDQGVRFS